GQVARQPRHRLNGGRGRLAQQVLQLLDVLDPLQRIPGSARRHRVPPPPLNPSPPPNRPPPPRPLPPLFLPGPSARVGAARRARSALPTTGQPRCPAARQ